MFVQSFTFTYFSLFIYFYVASSVEKDMSQKLVTLEECAEDQSTTVHCVQTQLSDILGQCEEEERVVADLAAAIEIKNSDLLVRCFSLVTVIIFLSRINFSV